MKDERTPQPPDQPPDAGRREELLERLNALLAPLEGDLAPLGAAPERPVVFVVAAGPRCGSTLLSQLLAATGCFAYPSNFGARFWRAPVLGAMLAAALGADEGPVALTSRYGRPDGWSGPHEFGNFLRRWLPLGDSHKSEVERVPADTAAMVNAELAALEAFAGKPVMLRNVVYGLHIPQIRQVLSRPLFVYCRRDPLYAAQSILLARRKHMGSDAAWWSLRPANWRELAELEPPDQVAAQLREIERAVLADAEGLPPGSFLAVDYERVCASPAGAVAGILEYFAPAGLDVAWDREKNPLPESLECTNVRRLDEAEFARLRQAVEGAR